MANKHPKERRFPIRRRERLGKRPEKARHCLAISQILGRPGRAQKSGDSVSTIQSHGTAESEAEGNKDHDGARRDSPNSGVTESRFQMVPAH